MNLSAILTIWQALKAAYKVYKALRKGEKVDIEAVVKEAKK